MKSIFSSKTFWVNVLSGILALLSLPSVGQLPPDVLAIVSVLTPVLNVLLRRLTSEPVSFKSPGGANTLRAAFIVLALGSLMGASACATNRPPALSASASVAYRNTQIVHALDLLRDTAIGLNAQQPPVIATADTRKIVMYHQSAIRILDSSVTGWQATLAAGAEEVIKQLPPAQKQLLVPYVSLIQSLIQGVK